MDRALSGFLVGFFLAIFLVSAAVKVQLGPLEPEVNMAISASQTFYDVAHSEVYNDIMDLAKWVNNTVDMASSSPLLGNLVPKDVPEAANKIVTLLNNVKGFSENLLSGLKFLLLVIQLSLPAMLVSLVVCAYGVYELYFVGKPKKAAARPAHKKSKRR